MYVLIADREADDYKKALAPIFPEIEFHAVTREADIQDHAEKMEVLVTVYRVSPTNCSGRPSISSGYRS
jgi:hypothetical protein